MVNKESSRTVIWQRNVESSHESPPGSFVQTLGSVGGSDDQDFVLLWSFGSVHLNEEFSFDPSNVVSFSLSSAAQHRVDLVQENDAGLKKLRNAEKSLDEFLWLSEPLGDQRGGRDVEKGRLELTGDCSSYHGLSCSGWTEKEDSSGGLSEALENVWSFHGVNNVLENEVLDLVESNDVWPGYMGIVAKNFVFDLLD